MSASAPSPDKVWEVAPGGLDDVPLEHVWHLQGAFLVTTHHAADIGLVGWKDIRWKHQERAMLPREDMPPKHMWRQAFDPDARSYYFYNTAIGLATWDPMDEFLPDETVAHYQRVGLAGPWQAEAHPASCSADRHIDEGTDEPKGTSIGAVRERDVLPELSETVVIPAAARFRPKGKGDLPPQVERYWIARYSLSSRWMDGVCLDEESLYSVTPEVLAQHHAATLRGRVVLDAFCGCGGNAIQFARVADRVIACDQNCVQLAMTQRNAEVYGVGDKVVLLHCDAFAVAGKVQVDAVFLSPPWGGPSAGGAAFDASVAIPGLGWGILECLVLARRCLSSSQLDCDAPNVAVFLPKTTQMNGLERACHQAGVIPLCLERNVLNGQLKALTLYLHAPPQKVL